MTGWLGSPKHGNWLGEKKKSAACLEFLFRAVSACEKDRAKEKRTVSHPVCFAAAAAQVCPSLIYCFPFRSLSPGTFRVMTEVGKRRDFFDAAVRGGGQKIGQRLATAREGATIFSIPCCCHRRRARRDPVSVFRTFLGIAASILSDRRQADQDCLLSIFSSSHSSSPSSES